MGWKFAFTGAAAICWSLIVLGYLEDMLLLAPGDPGPAEKCPGSPDQCPRFEYFEKSFIKAYRQQRNTFIGALGTLLGIVSGFFWVAGQ